MLERRLHARCGCAIGHAASARPFAFTHTPRNFERDRPFVVEHLDLDLELRPESKSLAATATLRVRRVDPAATGIDLDAIGFSIKSVTLDGAQAKYRYDGRVLHVTIGKRNKGSIAVRYEATPRRGMYFLAPDEHVRDRPNQVWTQCQEEDGRHFFPCQDKPHVKMTFEAKVTAPNKWSVLSNGALVSSRTPKSGAWHFHWKMDKPLPSYLVTIVAGEFATIEEKAGDVPVSYLVPKDRAKDAKRTFGRTPEMVKHFGELLGTAYPWNKYAQVVVSDFIFGGMENTTATTMYEYVLIDERAELDISSDDIIAHELAHHWFGDFLTCRDWSEGWLNEGFATYMEHAWREHALGMDEYEYALKGDLDTYVAEAHGRYRRSIVCQDYDAPLDLFDRHLYEKGGLVLHTLRVELGKELFWKGVGLYLKRHAHGIVETRDLMRALEEVSGRSLGRLFEQSVHKPGHVELEVNVRWDDGLLVIDTKQTQHAQDGVPSSFEFPLVIEIGHGTGAPTRERVRISQRAESFAIPLAKRPAWVVVDPEMRVLGDVTVTAPGDMLRAQLTGAKSARGRWLAALPLAKLGDPLALEALGETLADDREFWGVRAECAEGLARGRSKDAEAMLVEALKTKHPKVRRAVAAALGRYRSAKAAEALKAVALKDPSYMVEAEAARALGKTKQSAAYDVLLDVINRSSWAEVTAAAAVDGLAALRDDRATPHVLARTRYGQKMRVRRAAIMALPKLASDRRTREAIEELLEDSDPHLRIDVARALAEIGDSKSRGPLRAALEIDLDPRVRRRIREVLRDLGGEGKKALDQLREELEKLQNDHAALTSRLAKLEARDKRAKR